MKNKISKKIITLKKFKENEITKEHIYKNSQVSISSGGIGSDFGTGIMIIVTDSQMKLTGSLYKEASLLANSGLIKAVPTNTTFNILFSDNIKRTFKNYKYKLTEKGIDFLKNNDIKDLNTTKQKSINSFQKISFFLLFNIFLSPIVLRTIINSHYFMRKNGNINDIFISYDMFQRFRFITSYENWYLYLLNNVSISNLFQTVYYTGFLNSIFITSFLLWIYKYRENSKAKKILKI